MTGRSHGTQTGAHRNPRVVLRERARQNPPLLSAVFDDALAVCRDRNGPTARPEGWRKAWLVLRMIWEADGYLPLVLCRTANALVGRGIPFLPTVLRRLAIVAGQVHIGAPVILEPGIVLPHGQVAIDGFVRIGSGANIRPFVTIGLLEGNFSGPTIGRRVMIGTGAKILGLNQTGFTGEV